MEICLFLNVHHKYAYIVDDIIPSMIKYHEGLEKCAVISPILYKKDGNTLDSTFARSTKTPNHLILKYIAFGLCVPSLYTKIYGEESDMLYKNPKLLEKEYFEVDVISGSCFLIDKNTMQAIGGFDPNTFLYYEEDILSKKISRISKRNYVLTSSKLIHLGGSTAKKIHLFAAKANLKSADYYMLNYCNPNFTQRVLFRISVWMMKTKLAVLGLLYK